MGAYNEKKLMWHLAMKDRGYAARMVSFGFSSGLPSCFLFVILSIWLIDRGLSLTSVGIVAWTTIPYTLKGLLSPLVDKYKIIGLTKWLGQRKSWAIFTQLGIFVLLISLSAINPDQRPWLMTALCFGLSMCAAIQDIVLEAYRIEVVPVRLRSAMAGASALGFRLGMGLFGYGALIIAHYQSWAFSLKIMSCLVILGMVAVFTTPEPKTLPAAYSAEKYLTLLRDGLRHFKENYHISWVLSLLMTYQLGNIFIRSMCAAFSLELGFSKIDIADIEKGIGLLAIMAGTFFGAVFIQRKGIQWGMKVWASLQSASALLFIWHAFVGKNYFLLTASICIHQLIGGFGTTACIAYISSLCCPPGAAVHYALLTSFKSFGRIVVMSLSGIVADCFSWPVFFFIGALSCLPTLWIAIRPYAFVPKKH